MIDRIAFLLATGAEADGRDANLVRRDRRHVCGPRRPQRLDAWRVRKLRGVIDLRDIAALRGDKLAELGEAAAIGERAIDAGERRLPVARFPAADEHPG